MTVKERMLYLTSRGVTITEFANRVKCNKTTLGRWLRNETNLSKRLEKDLNEEINKYLLELDEIRE